jgi:hypothetical protein
LIANVRPGEIEIFTVWTRGISRDNKQEAVKMTRELQGTNIHHYWDPKQVVPTAYSRQFNWNETLAWDVYMFYGPETEWTSIDQPPEPELWFHQRSGVKTHTDKMVTEPQIRQILREMVTSPEK